VGGFGQIGVNDPPLYEASLAAAAAAVARSIARTLGDRHVVMR
jgi:hypothetical protein